MSPASDCSLCDLLFSESPLVMMEFPLSTLILQEDQFFEGYCLLASKRHLTELFELSPLDYKVLMEELSRVGKALKEEFSADKINYALLGNQVPHMHWHIIPRHKTDALWPDPIWARPHEKRLLNQADYTKLIERIRKRL
jgi:diadenosine tetraphosphate (Ap4A) HIT family hydrolase